MLLVKTGQSIILKKNYTSKPACHCAVARQKGNIIWNELPKSIKEIKTFCLFKKKNKNHFLLQQKDNNIYHYH